jgi:hypothetical protein
MRFIIRELSYEKPLAAGQLKYMLDGRPTGAVESWRLTTATTGYRFLRVDFDGREAENELTVLYHLVLDERSRPERLSFRVWRQGLQISGNVLAEDGTLIASRDLNGSRREDTISFDSGCSFWFPSAIGLGLLANCAQGGPLPDVGSTEAVTLEGALHGRKLSDPGSFALRRAEVRVQLGQAEPEKLMGRTLQLRPFTVDWNGAQRTLWLDEHGWPVKMIAEDGLTAVASRYARYV